MFYERLKELCTRKKTTPTELLKEWGMSSGNTGRWKEGKLPSVDVLLRMSAHFNVSIDYLLGNETVVNQYASLPQLNEREILLIEAFQECDEIGKMKIIQVAMNEKDRSELNGGFSETAKNIG